MNPAPATSARPRSGLAGSAATMASASSRGFLRADFARRSATLVAKSPCCASRVRSSTTASAAGGAGSTVPASLARESAELAHGQIERREQPHVQHAGIDPFQHERHGVVVSILVQQPECIAVLAVEVQKLRSSIGVAIRDLEILRKSDA